MEAEDVPSGPIDLLYVDDDEALLELTRTYLESEFDRFRVTTTPDVDAALDALEADAFDAVVSDYQMPGRDGLEFLQLVRDERESDVPFVIFTGRGREEVAIRALNLGANRYVQKGGDPASQYGVLAQAVERAVEHSQTRRQLKRREEKLRITLDSIGDAVITADEDGTVTRVNDAAEEITGWDAADAVGTDIATVFDIYDRETGDPIDDPVSVVLAEGAQVGLANGTTLRRKDGTEVVIADSAAPITDGEATVGVVVVFRDVTDRHRRRQKRRAQREAVVELATEEAIVRGDFETAVRRIVRTAAELLEVDRTNVWLFDGTDAETLRCVVEYDTETGFRERTTTISATEAQPYFDALRSHRALDAANAHEDSRTACLEESYLQPKNVDALLAAPVRSGGATSGVVCCEQRDVREWTADDVRFAGEMADLVQRVLANRESIRREQAFRSATELSALAFERLPLAAVEWSAAFEVTRWNDAAEDLFGYAEADVVGLSVDELFPGAAPEIRRAETTPVRQRRVVTTTATAPADGTRRCTWSTSVVESDGDTVGFVSIVQPADGADGPG